MNKCNEFNITDPKFHPTMKVLLILADCDFKINIYETVFLSEF